MNNLPSHIKVNYHRVIPHESVANVLSGFDLFFLPTRGENFGHAIYESLAVVTPVLISDQTPWQDLDETEVGWVRSLDDMQVF